MTLDFSSVAGLAMFGAIVSELVILLCAQQIGTFLDVLDHPDSIRKHHSHVTPLVGGIAIMVPLLMWAGAMLSLGVHVNSKLMLATLLCGAGATLIGYSDDQSSTSPSSRLLSLFLFSAIALTIDPSLIPFHLNSNLFPPIVLAPWMAYALIAVSMAGFVNAVNMADGQNGVVTGMFVIWSACLMIVTGGTTQSISLILFELALIAFLFNMAGRTFLGDAGTYGVAFVFGLLAIRAHNFWGISVETIAVWFFIPVADCLRLMLSRMLQGQAPSCGDRDHFHHRLQDRVGKNYGLLIYLSGVGSSSIVASLMPSLSVVCLLSLLAFYLSLSLIDVVPRDVFITDDARDAERFRLLAGRNVVVLEGRERNAEAG